MNERTTGRNKNMQYKISGFFESFTKKLPVIMQTEVTECGLACLAMIATWYDRVTDVYSMRKIFDVSSNGMSLRQLITAAGRINMNARAMRLELEELRCVRCPCILHWSFNHFVVLKKITKKNAVIHDPALGKRTISLKELSNKFTGIVLEVWPRLDFQKRKMGESIKITDMFKEVAGLRNTLLKTILLSLFIEALALSIPLSSQFIIDIVLRSSDFEMLNLIVIGVIFLLILRAVLSIIRAWTLMAMRYSLGIQWSIGFFNRLLSLPLTFFEKRHVGDIVSRLTSLNEIKEAFTAEMLTSLLDVLILLALVALMLCYSTFLAIISLLIASIYLGVKLALYDTYKGARVEAITNEARQSSHFLETVRNVACVKVFALTENRRMAWLNKVIETANARTHLFKIDLINQTLSGFLTGFSSAVILFFGGNLMEQGTITTGILFAFMLYADMFLTRSIKVVNSLFNFRLISIHSDRLTDVATAETESVWYPKNSVSLDNVAGRITLNSLSYRYGEAEPFIFKDIDMEINAGENIAIIGSSGCGKSTLLKIMAGLAIPQSGDVLVDGISIRQIGIDEYRRHTAFVMQDDKLFAASLMDNISSFDSQPNLEWIYECAKAAAIHDEIMAMPMQYETMIGDMGSILSGGQKQRVSLARALYKRPRILFLDEATSDLDVFNERKINEAVKQMSITRIFVAHRPETIAVADRIYNLKDKAFIKFERKTGTGHVRQDHFEYDEN
ncbi:peptidase domain-containing ABC transporter [Xenorhabdus griffiniae]|uniref:peptidase domain-containing ABC transporter n=1 Tax=Xenorhabdus griffiniae TaxID=351672 RepID=UPI002359A050|nr:peptidase domain-containing ABC transporter [Xenorhabdus griffiniae]MDC9606359.1 peptidase domain-containing ABC transporter [Xenorhabdus griffiniae]